MLKPYDVESVAAETASHSSVLTPAVTKSRPPRKAKVKKLFVLDTNFLMHDPTILCLFDEQYLYLPIATL